MKPTILKNTILKLFHKGYSKNLSTLMDRIHPADLALVFPDIKDSERKIFFDQIVDDKHAAKILSEMADRELVNKTIRGFDHKKICDVFHHMEPDDAADILGYLPTKDSEAILRLMQKDDATEVNSLLRYDPDTAGGMMTPNFIAVHPDNTAEEVIRKLRKIKNIDLIIYVYIVDKEGELLGYTPLNDLLMVPDETKMSKVMSSDVYHVRSHVTSDEVLRVANKYHLFEIPVVNKDKQLVGVVTADDVMDVMKHETTKRLLRNSGASYIEYPANVSLWTYIKARIWWLILCFLGGIGSAAVMQDLVWPAIGSISYLAMLPLIVVMSIVSSSQTSASIERNLFTGQMDGVSKIKVFYKEIKLSIIMGVIFGIIAGGYNYGTNYMLNQDPKMAVIIALGIFATFPVSAIIGFIMPILMTRIKKAPSGSTLPFTATISSLINVTLYLLISTNLMAIDIIIHI